MISHITLHLTDACNLKCDFCHVAAKRNTSNPCGIIDDNDIRKLFAASVGGVSVAGGEPFIDKGKLYHLLDLIPDTIPSIAVTTNGTLLMDGDFAALKARNVRLQFSVDGNKDEHEANRGGNTYGILRNNMEKAIATGLRVDLLTTVGKSNMDSIISFVEEMDRPGIDNMTLLHFTPKGRGTMHRGEEIDDIAWFGFVTSIGKKLQTRHMRVWIQPRVLTEEMVKACNSVRDITFCNCHDPRYAYVDLTTGNVYPCGLAYDTPLCFGSICDSSCATINDVVKNRDQFRIPSDCMDCPSLSSCKGGAKCYAWLENRDFNAKDPHCRGNSLLPICPFPAVLVSGPSMRTVKPTIV